MKLQTKHITVKSRLLNPITVATGQVRPLTNSETQSVLTTDYVGNHVFENGELKMTLFPGGYIRQMRTDRDFSCHSLYHYYSRDYQGNNRDVVVRDEEDGSPVTLQRTEYTPFGVPYPQTIGNAGVQPYKYSGKELDKMHGLNYYDFHKRFYDPLLASFLTIDPLCEKYYSISPYAYCANNPVNYIDPTGMVIDSLSQGQWDTQKNKITAQRDKLVEKNNNGKNDARIASLNGTLNNMSTLEGSDQVYSLQSVNGNAGQLRLDPTTGNVVIEYTGTANFVHEVTHGAQFESGEIGFDINTGKSVAGDIWDEVSAYTAQYHFDPSSIGTVTKADQITSQWVRGITDSQGLNVYGPNGAANTAQYPLNANSGAHSLMWAYPKTHPAAFLPVLGYKLRNFSNYRFR